MSAGIGLPEIAAAAIIVALMGYALTGGADFGGGVWDLLAAGPRRDEQRQLIADSIGPIWEANHVWLIVAVVVLFTGFPAAFGVMGTILHIPLTILLVGIVLRGSAFVFRSYGRADRAERFGLVFSIASVVTPFFLGIVVGAVSSDAVGRAMHLPTSASFVQRYVDPWFAPYPIAVGFFALELFAMLAAVYLANAAKTDALKEDFRQRALLAAIIAALAAGMAFLASILTAPRVARGLTATPWAGLLHALTAIAALGAIAALAVRRFNVARIAAAAQVALILIGWALAQYPYVVPPSLTIREAAAPAETLVLLLVGLVVGALVLIPSLRFLFKTFSRVDASRA